MWACLVFLKRKKQRIHINILFFSAKHAVFMGAMSFLVIWLTKGWMWQEGRSCAWLSNSCGSNEDGGVSDGC